MIKSIVAVSALFAASFAQATVYTITDVLQGNDGGYGFFSFHDASDNTTMTGGKLADITNAVISGSYNDMSGAFSAVLTVSAAGPTVTLMGTLFFDGSGFLNPASTVSVNFDNPIGLLSDTTIGFKAGGVCCSGTGDPNSFKDNVNDGDGFKVMSLWGANWNYAQGDDFDGLSYEGSTLGMDLRLRFDEGRPPAGVPTPAAVWLFGSGLLGLVEVARRRRS